jgi:hypothetical protein
MCWSPTCARPERTLDDVLALLRKTPGKVSFASSGNGSSDHLSAELFWQQSKTEGVHVPYKGGAPAINDLLGNQVDFLFPERERRAAAHPRGQAARHRRHRRQALTRAARRAYAG